MILAARLLVVVTVVSGLSGCTGVAATETGGDPFAGFPPCEPPNAQDVVASAAEVPGLVLPEGAVVTSTSRTGPITDVAAYVPLTPLDVRAFYEGGGVHDDVEILQLEDEVFETEVLLAHGELRTYLIARTACREGSSITGFIAPESAVADLPTGQVGSR